MSGGILPAQKIRQAIEDGWIGGDPPADDIQPASLDLRLGAKAYALRCSFLPDDQVSIETKLADLALTEFDIRQGAVLERNRPYLIPLAERVALPADVRGRTNPKSSTGRIDVFTRVISEGNFRFDEIPAGYDGPLFLEIVSRSFAIRVEEGLTLNQLRLVAGDARCSDAQIVALHDESPLIYADDAPLSGAELRLADGLFLSVDLERGEEPAGYKARPNAPLLDLARVGEHDGESFWEPIYAVDGRIILQPEEFYLLISRERVQIPPWLGAEMTAYDPTAGELRTHYAGFFDPGFGYDPEVSAFTGSRAALEVRAHDVPFAVEHGQNICKLSFERMIEPPDRLYGYALDSNYQGQEVALSKHFRRERPRGPSQPSLFS